MVEETSGAIANIGDLAKPITTLIEKIADATGILYEPYQILRIAKAKAAAEKIKVLARLDIKEELERRTIKRFLSEETKKQKNAERIIAGALPRLEEDASPEEIDDDWLSKFFNEAKLIGDAEMQTLWSRLLAGEANDPGTFSKRTLAIVATLDKEMAQLFTKFCGFSVIDEHPFIYDVSDEFIENHLSYSQILDLEVFGLINLNVVNGFGRYVDLEQPVFTYFDVDIRLGLDAGEDGKFRMHIGHILFTNAGRELARISGAQPIEGFLDYCVEQWIKCGYRPHSLLVEKQ
jgi:hypothetical protein